MSDEKINFSKKDQRQVTSFIGHELLYDFVIKKLDQERMSAVEEFVKTSKEAQSDIQNMNNSLSYLEQISQTVVEDALYEEINQPSTYFDQLLKKTKIDEWPKSVRMATELLVVSIGVIAIILVIPWHKVMEINFSKNKEIVLLEMETGKSEKTAELAANERTDAATTFPDEGIKPVDKIVETKPTETKVAAAKPVEVKTTEAPQPESKFSNFKLPEIKLPEVNFARVKQFFQKAEKTPEKQVAKVVPPTTPSAAVAPVAPVTTQAAVEPPIATTTQVAEKSGKSEKRQGFLYRGEIRVTNMTATSKKFVDYITDLGGRKAGEVPIGWEKGNSTYFHFTMPDAKFANLQEIMKSYGNLKIQKENHERVMPEGIIRIIITVYEK